MHHIVYQHIYKTIIRVDMRKLKKIVHKLVQPRHFFKGPVPIQKSDRSCICVLEISILSIYAIFTC